MTSEKPMPDEFHLTKRPVAEQIARYFEMEPDPANIVLAEVLLRGIQEDLPGLGLQITCDRCGSKLTEQGAVLWSAPNFEKRCRKYHLCRGCGSDVIALIKTGEGK